MRRREPKFWIRACFWIEAHGALLFWAFVTLILVTTALAAILPGWRHLITE